jgi:hypothetical protein
MLGWHCPKNTPTNAVLEAQQLRNDDQQRHDELPQTLCSRNPGLPVSPCLVCPLSGGDLRPLPEGDEPNREAVLRRQETLLGRNLAGNDEMDAGAETEEPVCAKYILQEAAGPHQRIPRS